MKKILSILLIPVISSCVSQSSIDQINKEITDLKLQNQELQYKFDKVVSLIPNSKEIKELNKINLFNKDDSEPVKIVKSYLLANTWEERVKYVLDPEKVKPLMEKRLRNVDLRKTEIHSVKPPKEIKDNWLEIKAYLPDENNELYEYIYYLTKVKNEYKIDWLSSSGYNDETLANILLTQKHEPTKLRLTIVNEPFGSSSPLTLKPKENYLSLVIYDREVKTAFVDKYTDDGKKILELLKDGKKHTVILVVRLVENNDFQEFLIEKFVQEGWLE